MDQINSINNTSLGMEDACRLLRQNINMVPVEYRESFYLAIDSIEAKDSTIANVTNNISNLVCEIYWPWEWNWFRINETKKERHKHNHNLNQSILSKPTVIMFGFIVAGLTLVAIFNPAAITLALDAMLKAAPLFM